MLLPSRGEPICRNKKFKKLVQSCARRKGCVSKTLEPDIMLRKSFAAVVSIRGIIHEVSHASVPSSCTVGYEERENYKVILLYY